VQVPTGCAVPAAAQVRSENEARALSYSKRLAAELGIKEEQQTAADNQQQQQQQQQPGDGDG
jgi:hypothetical protein